MGSTHLNKRWGGGGQNPTVEEMRSALAELDARDPEHPDCWLSDESGWTIAAHESGRIVLENVESGEGPWHLARADREFVIELWQALQRGDLTAIHEHEWREGYRS
ncbi:MAG: hypothetical protein L0Y58_07660 [Verrucomicrobia subdivision 3 bacterium]|nr:hypothetical protein [Limisphaerales bacterium]